MKICIILLAVLLVGLAAFAPVLAATSSTPEIPFDGEVPLWPNVRPVLILSGSDYEIGYQWYQQLVQVFGKWILEDMQGDLAEPFTEEELKALATTEEYLKKYTPEMIDMYKGMADGGTDAGVKLTYNQVLAQFSGIKSFPGLTHESVWQQGKSDGCSGIAVWGKATTDGKLVCSSSQNTTLEWDITALVLPETGNSFIISPYSPLGCLSTSFSRPKLGAPGMNNKGLVYVREPDITSIPEAEWSLGLTENAAVLHALRFADDAKQAQDMILSFECGDGLMGGTWADIHGNAWCLESRENPKVIRKSGDYGENDFIWFTNNALSYEAGEFRDDARAGTIYVRHAGWMGPGTSGLSNISRNLHIWNMLNYYNGSVNFEFIKMMYRFAGEPDPAQSPIVEMDRGEDAPKAYEMFNTVKLLKNVADWHNGVVVVMLPDELEYYVCNGTPRTQTISNPYAVDPLHSFVQLKLEDSPSKITTAAKNQAAYELTRGEKALRNLGYSDAAYKVLKERFDQATIGWFNGVYYTKLASRTKGNESLYNWSKALRGYVACQTYAQNVYESIVPPPQSPEDLGLKPWGYWLKITK